MENHAKTIYISSFTLKCHFYCKFAKLSYRLGIWHWKLWSKQNNCKIKFSGFLKKLLRREDLRKSNCSIWPKHDGAWNCKLWKWVNVSPQKGSLCCWNSKWIEHFVHIKDSLYNKVTLCSYMINSYFCIHYVFSVYNLKHQILNKSQNIIYKPIYL